MSQLDREVRSRQAFRSSHPHSQEPVKEENSGRQGTGEERPGLFSGSANAGAQTSPGAMGLEQQLPSSGEPGSARQRLSDSMASNRESRSPDAFSSARQRFSEEVRSDPHLQSPGAFRPTDRSVDTPAPSSPVGKITPGMEDAPHQENVPPSRTPGEYPLADGARRPNATMRELRVKVWQETETTVMPKEEKKAAPQNDAVQEEQRVPAESGGAREMPLPPGDVDDLPTRPLIASSPPPDLLIQRSSTPRSSQNEQPRPSASHIEAVEQLDTARLAAQTPPRQMPQLQGRSMPPQPAPRDYPAFQRPPRNLPPIPNTPLPPAYNMPPAQARPPMPSPVPPPNWSPMPPASPVREPEPRASRPRSRKPLIITLILVLLLALGGTGAWIALTQPFTVPQVSIPRQSFSDASLGISLSYPNGWKEHTDHAQGEASFYDSNNHTVQVNVLSVAANGQDPAQFLQKEATQLGMTGVKSAAPLSFAGTSWQQVQGSVQQSGANYSETLLATTHNGRLFALMQLAPQQVYADAEQTIFSAIRTSFQFI